MTYFKGTLNINKQIKLLNQHITMVCNWKRSMAADYIRSANPALAVDESRSFQNTADLPVLALLSKIRCVITTCESLNLNLQRAVNMKLTC